LKNPVNGTWDFETSTIFAQVDAFVQRCKDLVDICEGQVQFARKENKGVKIPLPVFGGYKGSEVVKSFEALETAFDKLINQLWLKKAFILDVKAGQWHDEYNIFKNGVKDLELMIQNIITLAFEDVSGIRAYIELLDTFFYIAKRNSIKRMVEKKCSELFNLLLQELTVIKTEFERYRKTPPILRAHPDFAGSVFWAKSLMKRMKCSYEYLQNSQTIEFYTSNYLYIEFLSQYESLNAALDDYCNKTHHEYTASTQVSCLPRLNIPLLIRDNDGFLKINFDKEITRIINETHYWQKLKFDVSFHANDIYVRKDELRILRESLLSLVKDYNALFDGIRFEDQGLFKERLKFLDRKMNPGLTNLTWASKGITEMFVKDSRKVFNDMLEIVKKFLDSHARIEQNLSNITSLSLCHIEPKRIYSLQEFKILQSEHMDAVREKLLKYHAQIKNLTVIIGDSFKSDGKEVKACLARYVENVDKLIEDAIRTLLKFSLNDLIKALDGDKNYKESNVEVFPLISVEVVLENQKIEFNPVHI
jgi:dynein heavy chain